MPRLRRCGSALKHLVKRIVNIDIDPCQVRELNGTVRFKRADAAQRKVTALDFNESRFSLQIHFRGFASLENPLSFFLIHEFKLISSYHQTHSQVLKNVISSSRLHG